MIRRADGTVDEIGKEIAGFPLGFIAQPDYKQTVVRLSRGDVVVVLSDGVNYARNPPRRTLRVAGKSPASEQGRRNPGTSLSPGRAQFSRTSASSPRGERLGDDMTLICFGPI